MADEYVDRIRDIRIVPVQLGERHFTAIKICIGDLHFSCDATGPREIRLAHRLSVSHGCQLVVDPDVASRVQAALEMK